ncbi:hypothetical protein M0805_000786 [Coniferiporia weirii]|nr:hypothetical protein M0805_000786 [Coniferiporia weirii]
MPPNAVDRKLESIDVDALFEDIELMEARSPARARAERKRERGAQSVARSQLIWSGSGSSQQPISLVSDDEYESTQSRDRGKLSGVNTGIASKTSAKGKGKEKKQKLSLPSPTQRPTAGASHTAATKTHPQTTSIRTSVAGPSRLPTNVSVLEDSDVEMDVDPAEVNVLRKRKISAVDAGPGSGYGSDSSHNSLSGSDDVEMEESSDDAGPPVLIDLRAMLGLDEEKPTVRRELQPQNLAYSRVTSRVMSKHETSGSWTQVKDPYRRLWDIPTDAFPTSLFKPPKADFSKRIARKGIFSPGPSSWARRTPINCMLTATPLRLAHPQHKKTSGSITKIAQSHGHIAVASATSGGGSDPVPDPDNPSQVHPQIDPYNTDGNLLVWTGKEYLPYSLSFPNDVITLEQRKVYTVNDIAFDPQRPGRLVSSGNDCIVHIWDLQNRADGSFEPRPLNNLELHYSGAPHGIGFKPNSSVFAVGCFDGNVHIHSDNEHITLRAVYDPATSKPGAFLWGGSSENQRLENLLFVSSESDDDNVACKHVVFDVEQECEAYCLKVDDSGDEMALSPNGDTFALISGTSSESTLSLFDVARSNGRKPTTNLTLPPPVYVPNSDVPPEVAEVSSAAFSPDGVLLALSRMDNVTLVYDVRFLSDGRPGGARHWACLRHPHRESTSGFGYGTTGLQWVESFAHAGPGLVTAASDGCVRLWDVMHAPSDDKESLILAEVDHDVACFSIGDQSKDERRLIVGDCGGEVYIFD